MAYKYVDATNRASDPSETGLLYVDARHEYTDPASVELLRLDATNNWSVAEVGKIITADQLATADWRDVAFTAKAAAKDPASYAAFVGKEKTLSVSDGEKAYTVTARIDGVGQDTVQGGAKGGFTFDVYEGLPTHRWNDAAHYWGGEAAPQDSAYDTSEARNWLESLTFEGDVAKHMQSFAVRYRRPQVQDPVDPLHPEQWAWKPPTAAETIYAKVAPLSAANMYSTAAASDYSMAVFEDEGPLYTFFASAGTDRTKRYGQGVDEKKVTSGWPSTGLYTLTAVDFCNIAMAGPEGGLVVLNEAWDWCGMSCRFVLGSAA